MPERSTISQVVQFGKETTSGTGVSANKLMTALDLDVTADLSFDQFMPSGFKYPTLNPLGTDMTTVGVKAKPTFTEFVYILSSLFGAATITTPMGATNARLWTFNEVYNADTTPVTFTVEKGSAVRAFKFSYGTFTGFTMSGDRRKVDLSGAMFGQNLTDGITLTSTPTSVALIPILGKQVDVFSDATSGGLGTTKLSRLLKWEISVVSAFVPLWIVDSSKASFVTAVQTAPQGRVKLTLEADSNGMTPLSDARAGTRKFIRWQADAGVNSIESGQSYNVTFDLACDLVAGVPFKDQDAVYAADYEFAISADTGWGKAILPTVKNTLTAL